ncbi:SURF1 family protein [Pseudolysinimonas sp.]|uniref:SURF1 family cytochrome oxidase biogenesis protein n=1 Tax=Pseudolysinimonas sp. TaxID=2680009 RepID=UPI00286AA2F2|nr:SURF1 family protein [Pseudolysinimonas sp.]
MSWIRRWGGYVALTVVFAVVCGLLSWWQWSRRVDAVDEIARIETNYDALPAPLDDLLPDLDSADESTEWRPVVITGEYLPEEQLLVRNRPRNSAAGFEVLVPLRLDDGTVFVVDRGWVPAGATPEAPESVPAAPEGEVTVVVRLKPGEPEIPGRGAPEGQLATVRLPDVAALVDAPTYTGMYGLLVSEDPAPVESPLPALRPTEDEGPHLSYALQWIMFGILAFVGLVWAVRRERKIAAGDAPVVRRERDAEVEDALLDAQNEVAKN